jgi:hypothetical protein
MKAKFWYLLSVLSLLAAITFLIEAWHGTMSFTASSPISASQFKLCGEASGGWVMAAIGALVGAAILLVVAFVETLRSPFRRRKRDVPPVLPTTRTPV